MKIFVADKRYRCCNIDFWWEGKLELILSIKHTKYALMLWDDGTYYWLTKNTLEPDFQIDVLFSFLHRCQSLSNMLYRTQDSTYDRRFSFDTKSFFKSNATSHGDRNFVKRKRNKSDDVSMENGMTQVTQSNASRSTRGSGQSNGANEFGKPLVCIESNL